MPHKIQRDKNIYFVYRHRRLDNNQIFYVGIGIKRKLHSLTIESEYERAFVTKTRSNFWKNVSNKTDYKVEILMECSSKERVINVEKELIKIYGRKDLKSGTLVNFTSGGEGIEKLNQEIEKLRVSKISQALKNRIRRPETFIKIAEAKYKKVVRSDGKEFNSITEAAKELNISIAAISKTLKNDKYTAGGYKWKYKSL